MVLPILLGVATAGAGLAKTFGERDQQISQTNAINKQRSDQYKNLVRQYQLEAARRQSLYNQQLAAYKQGTFEDYRSYGRALVDSQEQLSELYGQAAFGRQQQNISLAQQQGQIAAAGRTGSSAARLMGAVTGQYGRTQAITMDNLLRARYATTRTNERLRDQLTSSLRQRYNQVAVAPSMPVAPVEPTFQEGPSQFSLFTNIAGNILDGVSAGLGAKADMLGNGGGGGETFGPKKFDLNKNFFTGNGPGSFLPPTDLNLGIPRYY